MIHINIGSNLNSKYGTKFKNISIAINLLIDSKLKIRADQKVFYDFYEDIAELELEKREEGEIHQGWRESFRKNFEISYDDFLIEFENFVNLTSKEQLDILDKINY